MTSHLEDGRHDVISQRKVLPCGERSVYPAHMQPRSPVLDL